MSPRRTDEMSACICLCPQCRTPSVSKLSASDNPGYYRKYYRRRKLAEQVVPPEIASEARPMEQLMLPFPPVRLALPAPVDMPIIEGINTISQMAGRLKLPVASPDQFRDAA